MYCVKISPFFFKVLVYDQSNSCDKVVPGLHAAGEAVSNCHGANRLGANSILDITVFGRAIGINVGKIAQPGARQPVLNDVCPYNSKCF